MSRLTHHGMPLDLSMHFMRRRPKELKSHDRGMLTIAALTVLGYPRGELRDHIKVTLNIVGTQEEVLETIIQMALYGFPAALEATKTATSVFNESHAAIEASSDAVATA